MRIEVTNACFQLASKITRGPFTPSIGREAKAKTFFDVCSLFFDLSAFHLRFRPM